MSSFAKLFLALFAALLLFAGGIFLGGHPEALPGPARDALVDDDRAVRAEIVEAIKDNYYKPVKNSQIDEASLKGIVAGLGDQFSNYITPKEAKEFEQSLRGEFEGVGMNVDEDRRGLRVVRVFDGSPAEKAGIEAGEFVTAVNGRSIAGVASQIATSRIKGKAGTKVRLEIVNPDEGTPRTLKLTRAKIEVPTSEGRVEKRGLDTFGVVELTNFGPGAHGELRKQIDKLLEQNVDGLVLDLRGNGGGLLSEAVLVSSQFIEDGLITFTKGRTRSKREFEAEGEAIAADVPVVVLVDGGSASASEIVTGALRDRKRGTVVGVKTFGKGVFQEVESLSNGGQLSITVGEYFLPSGENIGKKGVTPTVKAEDDPDTERDEAIPIALKTLQEKK
ncbi:MAG: S41 family peptidase [Thermoleophilaceae bacterium]